MGRNRTQEDTMTTTQHDPAAARRERIRVPAEIPTGLLGKVIVWWSRRTYGDVPDPGLVMNHNRKVLFTTMRNEMRIQKWDALDPELKTLAQVASAATIGCSWCLDFGYYAAHSDGQPVDKLKDVPRWRESDVFTPVEREVLAYSEAMTVTPPEVTDEMVDGLVARLGVPAVVELTMMVAVENERSRFNSAMGLTSQGFSDRCELPAPAKGR
jgi:AhpD family alkylhydroperoxidase